MLTAALFYCASFIRTYIHEICFGITAVTLMLFGPGINNSVRRLTRKLHWLLRYTVFVVLCTGGYVFLSQAIYRATKHLLLMCSKPFLVFVTVGIYLVLAWIAKEQKAI